MRVDGPSGGMQGIHNMNFIRSQYLPLIFRVILGIIFIYASYDKILDPAGFSKNIHNFHVTPIAIENIMALVLPWIELIIGTFLIFGLFLDGTINITIALLILFIIVLSQAVFRGIDVHCGCFKTEADAGTTDLRLELIKRIGEDFIYLAMAYIVKFRKK